MAFNAGAIELDVLPDTSRLGSTLDRSLSSSRSRFQGMGKKVGLAIGAGIGIGLVALGKVAMDSIAAAQEAVEVEAQTAAVLKSTGGAANVTEKQIGKLSSTISQYAAISDETIRTGANMLLTFTNIRNEVGKGNDIFDQATATITDMSVALDQDMSSSAVQLGKALNDPIKGITALSRVGVSFTEQQKAQITTLVESGNVMGAQKIILAELTKEFGGSAKAVGDTKPWEKFKLAVGEVQESIGRALLPIIGKLAQDLAAFVQSDQFQKWLRTLTAWLKENVPKAINAAVTAFNFIKDNAKTLATVLGGVLAAAIGIKVVSAVKALNIALRANPFVFIAAAAIALAILIVTNWDKIKAVTIRVFNAVKNFLGDVWRNIKNTIADVVGGIIAFLVRAWANFLEFFFKIAGGILDAAAKAFGWVPKIGDRIKEFRDDFDRTTKRIISDLRAQADGFQRWGERSRSEVQKTLDEVLDLAENFKGMALAANIKISVQKPRGDGIGLGAHPGGTPGAMMNWAIGRYDHGLVPTSGYRPGAITSSGNPSLHGIPPPNNAWDFAGPAGSMLFAARGLAARFGSHLRELIHTPLGFSIKNGQRVAPIAASDHYSHVHVADAGLRVRGPALVRIGNIKEDVAFIPRTGPGAVGMGPTVNLYAENIYGYEDLERVVVQAYDKAVWRLGG